MIFSTLLSFIPSWTFFFRSSAAVLPTDSSVRRSLESTNVSSSKSTKRGSHAHKLCIRQSRRLWCKARQVSSPSYFLLWIELSRHVRVQTGPAHHYIFSIQNDSSVKHGEIAFGVPHRKWAVLSLDQEVRVTPFTFERSDYVGNIVLSADFNGKKKWDKFNFIFIMFFF